MLAQKEQLNTAMSEATGDTDVVTLKNEVPIEGSTCWEKIKVKKQSMCAGDFLKLGSNIIYCNKTSLKSQEPFANTFWSIVGN